MVELKLFQVDAFTARQFKGNPAAVCPLDSWLHDDTLQNIAMENNLSETAFFVPKAERFELRWFTPAMEVDLCGHATLAAAHVIFEYFSPSAVTLVFETQSGDLSVQKDGDLLSMLFPSRPPEEGEIEEGLTEALGAEPEEVLKSRDYFVLYRDEEYIRKIRPNFQLLAGLSCLGVIITAPGRKVDFVSRFFAPGAGIPEDPVTGSAHCTLIPYWSRRLGKSKLHALQLSGRGGELFCEDLGDRVKISGKAVTYLEGKIFLG